MNNETIMHVKRILTYKHELSIGKDKNMDT